MFWCRNFRNVKPLWYASTVNMEKSAWKKILKDEKNGYIEIASRCTMAFAEMLFSACDTYYDNWDEMDAEISYPQA